MHKGPWTPEEDEAIIRCGLAWAAVHGQMGWACSCCAAPVAAALPLGARQLPPAAPVLLPLHSAHPTCRLDFLVCCLLCGPQAGGHPRPPEVDHDCRAPAGAHRQAVPGAVSLCWLGGGFSLPGLECAEQGYGVWSTCSSFYAEPNGLTAPTLQTSSAMFQEGWPATIGLQPLPLPPNSIPHTRLAPPSSIISLSRSPLRLNPDTQVAQPPEPPLKHQCLSHQVIMLVFTLTHAQVAQPPEPRHQARRLVAAGG